MNHIRHAWDWCVAKVKAGWRWLKRRFTRAPGWGSEPRDAAHQYFRTQYERMVETLPHLPRVPDNETNAAFLAFAQVVHELHDRGDDPIMPPGVRRVVVRETQRLARFGAVGQTSVWDRIVASLIPFLPYILIGGLLLSVTGWGSSMWNGWRADRLENQRNEARAELEATERDLVQANAERDLLRDAVTAADELSRQTAANLEAERARARESAARERRRQRAIREVDAGGPPPAWEHSLRDTGAPGPDAGRSGDAAGARPE